MIAPLSGAMQQMEPPPMPSTPLIVIVGPPASGKTALARRLATDLRLPLLSRDDFKERLFDTLGVTWPTAGADQSARGEARVRAEGQPPHPWFR